MHVGGSCNHSGQILQVWSKRIFSSNPIFAEVVALLWTLEISLDMKYLNIVV